MKIGILGSGVVGQTLANGFIKHGHQVKIGTEHPDKLSDWIKNAGNNNSVGSFAEAAQFGEAVVLAVKGLSAKIVLEKAGTKNIRNKTIIDTTNPIADAPPVNGVLKFFTDLDLSLMEELQNLYIDANFVKEFRCVGNALIVNQNLDGQKQTIFIKNNNKKKKNKKKKFLDA